MDKNSSHSTDVPSPTSSGLSEENIQAKTIQKRFRTVKEQIQHNTEKHPMLPACKCKQLKCFEKFTNSQRKNIHSIYWNLNSKEQRIWVSGKIDEISAKRRLVGSERRDISRIYYLPSCSEENVSEKNVKVCMEFFNTTLGFAKTNSSFINTALKAKRKNFQTVPRISSNKKDNEIIKNHILSFHPYPSHYRRAHAPNRLYLPPELTIRFMYEDFSSNTSNPKLSYELYRQNICNMNISFKESQSEICGYCLEMDINNNEENSKNKAEHLNKAEHARKQYNLDALIKDDGDTKVYSADMQKVVLLPRMPKVKESFFVPRLIVFNETFAAMQKTSNHFCILWTEAVADRRAENVSSAFINFFQKLRDHRNIILWLDNCGGQNKNNIIYSAIITYINSDSTLTQNITLKYLVKGHTFMAADGIHGKIEQIMRKNQNVYDFNDFFNAVKSSSPRMVPVVLEPPNFIKFKNIMKKRTRSTRNPLPYFSDIVEAKFTKGCKDFFFKTSFLDVEYKKTSGTVNEKTNLITICEDFSAKHRGISETKKEKILKELVSKMPINRRDFWINLPCNKSSEDLLSSV